MCQSQPPNSSPAFPLGSVQFSCSIVSNSLWPHGLLHTRPPCTSSTPRVYSNSCPLSWWHHPIISSSVVPFSSCPQSLAASGSFPMSQCFTWSGWSIGVQLQHLSFIISQSLLKFTSFESVMPSHHLILCDPFSSCPQSFPASGSFQMSQFFALGGQSIGVSTTVLPMNIQDWSPLGWTGWISLQSKGLSRVFSNTTVQKHQFFGT